MKAPTIRRTMWLTTTCLVTMLLFLGIQSARCEIEIHSGTTLIVKPSVQLIDSGATNLVGGVLENRGILIAARAIVDANGTLINYGEATVYDSIVVKAGIVVNNQSMYVNGDAIIVGGDLDVLGTLVVKGNFINKNLTEVDRGTGIVLFSGTSTTAFQEIHGTNRFGILRIENTGKGVYLVEGNQTITGGLELNNGLVYLDGNQMLLGPAATVTGGSATSMVVTDGVGELRKEFPSAPYSFTYPVGDNTGTPEFTPVTLDFASGTFPGGNYVGIKVIDDNVPDPGITSGTHISRYWTVDNNLSYPITGFSCTASFKYVDDDVVVTNGGAETDLFLLKVSPLISYNPVNAGTNTLSGTLNSWSTFTGGKAGLQASFNVFLQGPYSAVNHNMNTTLASTLTLGDRSDQTKFPKNQPYNVSPWNYAGTESVETLPSNVVDWVLIELRQSATASSATAATIIGKRAAFLKNDGSIVDLDGTPLKFYNASVTQNLYPVIRHRNHMAVMAAATGASKNNEGIYVYDFTSGSGQMYGGSNGAIQLESSPERWGLRAGDGSADNRIYLDDVNSYWVVNSGSTHIYSRGDFNMDNSVYLNDVNTYWVPNSGKTNLLP
ncbi:MAG: hypothetical protein NT040_18255 [Bacteroidetes bacterium]|nr:hypothetical protein [Bacteroidota bacterium]